MFVNSKKGSAKSYMTFHENLQELHVGTRNDHNYFIPFGKQQNAFCVRENSERFELLNGQWDFSYFDSIIDLPDDFTDMAFDDKITVPSNWQLFGYDKAQYTNINYPIPFDPPYVPDNNPVGIYKREYDFIPDGMRKILCFEGVDSCFYLYVNSVFAGYSQVSHHTSEFDVTDLLKAGKNEITVAVLKWCDGTYLEDQDKFRLSGIFRDVYVLSRPEKRLENYVIKAEPDKNSGNGIFSITLQGSDAVIRLFDGETLIFEDTAYDGKTLEKNVKNINLWSAESPYLYKLEIESGSELIGEKVGFRKVYVENGVLKLNGRHIKIFGANRHDSYPDTGYYADKARMRNDLTLMKKANINAVRTSHYPNAPEFYSICDELGLYVIDEADIETHGCINISNKYDVTGYDAISLIACDERFSQAILDREKLLVTRDINRPCVIFWSLGNESGYGANFKEGAKLIKSIDPTRLVHYESVASLDKTPYDDLDVLSAMYWSPDTIRKFMGGKNEKRPFLLCEYCHAMGNGPGDLEEYHDLFMENDRLCGGLIWEWADHAVILGKTDDGKIKYGYGGDSGEKHDDGNFCMDGLCYPDRKPHTGYFEAKQVYRPVRVEMTEKGKFKISSLLRFINAGDFLDCKWEITSCGETIYSGGFVFSVEPMSECEIEIKEADGIFANDAYVRFIFTAKNGYGCFDDGEEVCFDQIKIFTAERQPLTLSEKDVNYEEKPLEYVIRTDKAGYVFDRRKAAFSAIIIDGVNVLEREAEYNFFRAPTDNDRFIKEKWFKNHLGDCEVKVYSTEITKENGCAVIKAKQSFGWSINEPFAKIEAKYVIDATGILDVSCKAVTSKKIDFIPRFGLRFFLKDDFSDVEYFGYGPNESYIDKHHSSCFGRFCDKVENMHEDYIFPQENGSHFGCEKMTVKSDSYSLSFIQPDGFSFNASPYTQEELAEKKHNFELEKSGYTVICADFKMAGVGSNSCGPELPERFRIKLPEMSGKIRIIPETIR